MEAALYRFLRKTRSLIWLNTFLLASLTIILLFVLGGNSSETVFYIPMMGLVFGMGNYILTAKFLVGNARAELMDSYEKIKESIIIDELTGVYNRRAGLERLREEFARSLRRGEKLSVAMVDIDNFKGINDTYGHLAGDHVLKSVATALKRDLRTSDIVFRYGGEEFLIIMPETDETQAVVPLDRLRAKLSDMRIRSGSLQIKTSVSIGISTVFNAEEGLEEAIHRADRALYRAKSTGRNKVVSDERITSYAPYMNTAHCNVN